MEVTSVQNANIIVWNNAGEGVLFFSEETPKWGDGVGRAKERAPVVVVKLLHECPRRKCWLQRQMERKRA